ncbi:7-carboxy-7-deazaguanine synthase [Adhaeribacter aerolatus]|uniref:7-carboxy-7-deazaguanine synthase n=2 Tax=Adhaeribacter aerolatus TaxID=670289 RepID=A0A512AYD9_9BACT|nr:7-carboxy-7-deazaguanine synthase [Adhaeribacter aerolatus]
MEDLKEITQASIHSVPKDGSILPVMEAFYTVQGEGFYTGHAAYFIRLAGCDVGCHWCDVKESWDAEQHPLTALDDIVAGALAFPGRLVVITGGEPLIYNLSPLTAKLKAAGFQINIETSGAYPLSGNIDWVCLSPKKFKQPVTEILPKAQELKIIVFNKSDFKWAEDYAAQVSPATRLYLQPEWSRHAEMLPLIIDYVKEHPKWQISLQTHKYMNIP